MTLRICVWSCYCGVTHSLCCTMTWTLTSLRWRTGESGKCPSIHTRTHTHIHIHTCTYTCTYTYTYTHHPSRHTHSHTYAHRSSSPHTPHAFALCTTVVRHSKSSPPPFALSPRPQATPPLLTRVCMCVVGCVAGCGLQERVLPGGHGSGHSKVPRLWGIHP